MTAARALLCKGCLQQLHIPVVLRGPASVPYRLFGIRPSRMNPNICTVCELMFALFRRGRKVVVDVSVMFADLRGYTALSETGSPEEVGALLDEFYDLAAAAIWAHDGLLNKTAGDSAMAIFNFPFQMPDHAAQAVQAARELQAAFAASSRSEGLRAAGIGIGIDSGPVSFGEFGHAHRDLTAIGTVVNLAARAQAVAAPGEILVTGRVRERAGELLRDAAPRSCSLKGFAEPVTLYAA